MSNIFKSDGQNTTSAQENGYANLLFSQLDQLLVHFSLVRPHHNKSACVRVNVWKYTINLCMAVCASGYRDCVCSHAHMRTRIYAHSNSGMCWYVQNVVQLKVTLANMHENMGPPTTDTKQIPTLLTTLRAYIHMHQPAPGRSAEPRWVRTFVVCGQRPR